MTRPDRRAAYLFGLDAEYWAEILLRAKGYTILSRRFLSAGAEIDLIAQRGKTVVFVEVKARGSLDAALLTITPRKLERIARAARAYLARLPHLPQSIRCDAILVAPGHFPRHIKAIGELPLD
jgi:putative endonuclease